MPRRGLYNWLEPIRNNEFPQNHAAIGLWVDTPYPNPNAGLGQEGVDIHTEIPRYLDSLALISTVPTREWRSKARSLTEKIIADIDRVTQELFQHRARMVAELEELAKCEAMMSTESLIADERKTYHIRQIHDVDFYIQAPDATAAQDHAHVSIGAVTEAGDDVFCGDDLGAGVTLIDFNAAERASESRVEEA